MSVGDIGMLDERGFLRLADRASRMIITAGKNVHPEEIERARGGHPAIVAVGVLGATDERRGERLVALLRLGPDMRIACSDLISHARLSLPLYKIPRRFAVRRLFARFDFVSRYVLEICSGYGRDRLLCSADRVSCRWTHHAISN